MYVKLHSVHWTAKKYEDGRGPKDLKKSLHCIRAVSQQVSLKLNGWMAGLKRLEWDGGRDGWSGTLLSLSPVSPPPLFWHIQPSCLYFSPSNWERGSRSGRSAKMWHRPHLHLTNWEMARKYASTLKRLLKLKFEAGHMVLMEINTVAFIHSNSHHKKNKDSKIHNNYKNAIKLNVIEF